MSFRVWVLWCYFFDKHHGLSPAEWLQCLPLSFTITSSNPNANERLAPRTAVYCHISFSPNSLQALGCVGIAFCTSQIVVAGGTLWFRASWCWQSWLISGYCPLCSLSSFMLCEKQQTSGFKQNLRWAVWCFVGGECRWSYLECSTIWPAARPDPHVAVSSRI